eukprot:Phypoly_transcript_11531.p1 GENE.Phypoly_transcript_11531~~Phypoly_transcript_11531.p1  ORF type:complete len:170 (+),score=21.14 Phypoly_transcript_11531:542-1051(+)
MALSFFKSYLYAKVCIENLLFYENILHFRSVEARQTEMENVQLSYRIYRDFFQTGPGSGAYTLNIDSGLMKEVTESVNNIAKACTSTLFKNVFDLVIQQMQSEWFYFKKSQQGQTLLKNLNTNTFVILPEPATRTPVMLPSDWAASDDPMNWGMGSSSHSTQVCVGVSE